MAEATCTLRDPGKPTFGFAGFLASLARNAAGLPSLLAAFLGPGKIDPALREGVMISVSRMNRCRHCTAIHSAWGEAVGLDLEQGPAEPLDSAARFARCLLAGSDPPRAACELTGDCACSPPSEAPRWRRTLSPEMVRRLTAIARLIDFANRCGNTWDVFEARLEGRGGAGSLLDELAVLLALAPLGAPFLLVSRILRARCGEPVFPYY